MVMEIWEFSHEISYISSCIRDMAENLAVNRGFSMSGNLMASQVKSSGL